MAQDSIKPVKRISRAELADYARNASPLKEGVEYKVVFEKGEPALHEIAYTSNGNTYTYAGVEIADEKGKGTNKFLSLNVWRGRTIAVADENGKLSERTFDAMCAEDASLEDVFDALKENTDKAVYVVSATAYRGKSERGFYATKCRVLVLKK